ncbi:derlin-1-like [Bidens hawaiensis]|uniref:derlin-1-like n=1 Tax=Bidens hawaiensis TaxID=980011 RepID=UPI0040499C8B
MRIRYVGVICFLRYNLPNGTNSWKQTHYNPVMDVGLNMTAMKALFVGFKSSKTVYGFDCLDRQQLLSNVAAQHVVNGAMEGVNVFFFKTNALHTNFFRRWYNSLPPISKAYGTLCLVTTAAVSLQLLPIYYIALIHKEVFYHFQVWRLLTNFVFLGPFSMNFGIRLLMLARYGVQLENGPFNRRTADFLWMMIFGSLTLMVLSALPFVESYFMGVSLVFMLLYMWSREFPNANINIYGLVQLKAFYLPWAMLAMDVIFGSPLGPDLYGIIAGHLYYFLTVLHPLSGGEFMLQTPKLVHKIVAKYRIGVRKYTPMRESSNTNGAFRGRSYRVGD